MFEYNRKSSPKHGGSLASLSTPLAHAMDLGGQDGGWLGHSYGNHKEIEISKFLNIPRVRQEVSQH